MEKREAVRPAPLKGGGRGPRLDPGLKKRCPCYVEKMAGRARTWTSWMKRVDRTNEKRCHLKASYYVTDIIARLHLLQAPADALTTPLTFIARSPTPDLHRDVFIHSTTPRGRSATYSLNRAERLHGTRGGGRCALRAISYTPRRCNMYV